MNDQPQQKNPGIQKKETLLKELEASLEKESDKVTKIGKIIEKLEAAKKAIISQKEGQESTSYSRILEKYITFLEYIRSIIEAKIKKDKKITELQWEVFYRIDIIGQGINLTKNKLRDINNTSPSNEEIKKDENQLRLLREESDRLNIQLNKKNKQYLLDFNASKSGVDLYDINGNKKPVLHKAEADLLSCTQNIQEAIQDFNAALTDNQSGGMNITEQKSSEMKDYTSDDKEQFKNIIDSLFIINNTNGQKINILKTNNLGTNIINNNNNSKNKIQNKQNEHTKKLKKIKDAYEKGLKENIDNFEKICTALENLVKEVAKKTKILRENINKIKRNVNANKTEREKQITAIKEKIKKNESNKEEIKKLKQEIGEKNKENLKNKIILKVLDTSFLGNDVFKENREALVGEDGKGGLLKEITNAQKILTNAEIRVKDEFVNNSNLGQSISNPSIQGKQVQVQGQQAQSIGSSQTQGTRQVSQYQGTDTPPKTDISLTQTATKFFLSGKPIISNKEYTKEINEIIQRKEIDNKLDELEKLKNITSKTQEHKNKIDSLEEKIKQLFQDSDYSLTPVLRSKFAEIKVPKTNNNVDFTELQKYFLLKYITLLDKYGDFDTGLKILNTDEDSRKIINDIFATNVRKDRQKLLMDLYEQRPNRRNRNEGGKYKIKKSKKTSKTTPKKAKSNKKTPRTQTKSYNNQDGGFVRGGVLFPESFYRSDIVM